MTQRLADIILTNGADGGAVETVVYTITPIATSPSPQNPTPRVRISGQIQIVPGATATTITVRCRFNNLAGSTLKAGSVVPVTPGVLISIPFYFIDDTGAAEAVGGATYVITMQETAATGNGAINNLIGAVEVLT